MTIPQGFQLGYWLLVGDRWVEVTKTQYIATERAAGFSGPDPDEPATSAFMGLDGSAGSVLGPGRRR